MMNKINGLICRLYSRISRLNIKTSDSNHLNDNLGAITIETQDISDTISSRTVRSSTLNRYQSNKSKSPGIIRIYFDKYINPIIE